MTALVVQRLQRLTTSCAVEAFVIVDDVLLDEATDAHPHVPR